MTDLTFQVVTFDSYGVSGHNNHRSVYHSVQLVYILLINIRSNGVFTSSAIDCGLKPKTLKLVFVASPLSTQH